jgi:catechol 2,3-dioxygenase-like lactoylglutathione lyase family enzyme
MAIKVQGLAPLIQVFDMPRSIAFYRDVLGFEVVDTSPGRGADDFDWAMLVLDGTQLMLNTAYEELARPAEPDASRVRVHADTGLFFGCRDVDAVYSHLRAKGVNPEAPRVAPYGMKQLYVRDPDGYLICFQCRAD